MRTDRGGGRRQHQRHIHDKAEPPQEPANARERTERSEAAQETRAQKLVNWSMGKLKRRTFKIPALLIKDPNWLTN